MILKFFNPEHGGDVEQNLAALDGAVMSAFIRAKKPLAS
jgi:hypothetical protein